jgi:beta-ribofuranosylaminobenzene 5'-phosphate synthase
MTNLLELLTGGKVQLRTLKQEVVPSPVGPANLLQIGEGESVNERDIIMVRSSDEYPLLHAKSYTPISRLGPGFKSDLMRADIPIGKIMDKHRIEARRELIGVGLLETDESLEKLLHRSGPFIWRSYNIITREEPLITIRESFSELIYRLPTVGSS